MDVLPTLVSLAGALVGVQVLLLRHRARRDGRRLFPVPTQPLPDTSNVALLCLLLWVFAQLLVQVLLAAPNGARPDLVIGFLGFSTANLGVALLVLPWARHDAGVEQPKASVWLLGAALGLVAFSLVQATGLAIEVIDGVLGRETPPQEAVNLVREREGIEFALIALSAVVVAPVAEEIFYRGILLPAFARWMPIGAAVLLQAACFGLMHVALRPDQWLLAVPLGVVGWMCGRLYVRTRSLGAAIALHAVFNLVQVALMRVSPQA